MISHPLNMNFLSCFGAKRRFKKSAPKTLKSSRCRWLILLQRRPVIDWPWSTLPQSFKLNLIIFCKDCNWLAYVTSPADWCESDGRSLIITRVVFNLANLPIHESTLSPYLSRWGFLNYSSCCKYILSMREPSKGGWDPFVKWKMFPREQFHVWLCLRRVQLRSPLPGGRDWGRGIQNNWRPLGRLLSTMRPYILEVGSI